MSGAPTWVFGEKYRLKFLSRPKKVHTAEEEAEHDVWCDTILQKKKTHSTGRWEDVALSPNPRGDRTDLRVRCAYLTKGNVYLHRLLYYLCKYCKLGSTRRVGGKTYEEFSKTFEDGREVGHLGGKWWRILRGELTLMTGTRNRKQRIVP